MNDLFWLTLLLFFVAALLRSELFFYLLYIIIGLQVFARLWLRRSTKRLTWQRVAPPAAFPGEPVTVTLQIKNTSLLPMPWISVTESVPTALRSPASIREVWSLSAGEQRALEYTLVGRQRGYYQLGPLTLRTGDVLGLGERTVQGTSAGAVTIYPRVLPLHELGLPATLPYGTLAAQQRLFTDPARPAGVRPYQPSDGVRRIDWKSTAHSGIPVVRRSQPAIALETLIALAFNRENYNNRFAYDQMERAVIASASIAAHLNQRSQPIGLCSNGIDPANNIEGVVVPIGSGRAHLIEVLGALGRLEIGAQTSITAMLQRATSQLGWGSTLVLVTGQSSTDLIAALLPLKRRGLNIALVMCEPTSDELALPRGHGIATYALERDARPQAA